MSKVKNYIIFTLRRNLYRGTEPLYKWYASYYTREQFIGKLAQSYGKYNCILNRLSEDMSETECKRKYIENSKFFNGGYYCDDNIYFLAKIKDNRYYRVNIEDIIDDIIEQSIKVENKREKRIKKYNYEKQKNKSYIFRRDAIPNIHNYKSWHRGSTYRHPETTRSKRQNYVVGYEKEYEHLLSNKIKSLPCVYDDIIRHKDKCWKTSYKVRKQWQKHLK